MVSKGLKPFLLHALDLKVCRVVLAVPFVAKEGMGAALWSGSLPGFSIFGCYMLKHRELS